MSASPAAGQQPLSSPRWERSLPLSLSFEQKWSSDIFFSFQLENGGGGDMTWGKNCTVARFLKVRCLRIQLLEAIVLLWILAIEGGIWIPMSLWLILGLSIPGLFQMQICYHEFFLCISSLLCPSVPPLLTKPLIGFKDYWLDWLVSCREGLMQFCMFSTDMYHY